MFGHIEKTHDLVAHDTFFLCFCRTFFPWHMKDSTIQSYENFSFLHPHPIFLFWMIVPAVTHDTEGVGWREHPLLTLRDESGMVRKWAGKLRIVLYYDDPYFL